MCSCPAVTQTGRRLCESPCDPNVTLILKKSREYFGFQQDFPVGQLLTRSETGKKRNVYLASRLVRELVIRNGSNIKVTGVFIKPLFIVNCVVIITDY